MTCRKCEELCIDLIGQEHRLGTRAEIAENKLNKIKEKIMERIKKLESYVDVYRRLTFSTDDELWMRGARNTFLVEIEFLKSLLVREDETKDSR